MHRRLVLQPQVQGVEGSGPQVSSLPWCSPRSVETADACSPVAVRAPPRHPIDDSHVRFCRRGHTHLLQRTAHGACLHPLHPHVVLLFGGYGGRLCDGRWQWLQDLATVNTVRQAERMRASRSGAAEEEKKRRCMGSVFHFHVRV